VAIEGVFDEQPTAAHVRRRQAVLREQRWYPSTRAASATRIDAENVVAVFAHLKVGLESHGVATVQLDRILTNDEFISLAGLLGVPQLQEDARLQPWVEDQVILNVRADRLETEDLEWELLFAENYVMLHTELAGRMVESQVRHLLFQCVGAPPVDRGGQTLLVSMDTIRKAITDRQAAILTATRHTGYSDPPSFLSRIESRDVFAFKDAEGDSIPWRYNGGDDTVTGEEVQGSIAALLAAMYDPSTVTGISWTPHMLAAFDNRRFFHGRALSPREPDRPRRHLREVRVFSG
jgi:hypothetical protein